MVQLCGSASTESSATGGGEGLKPRSLTEVIIIIIIIIIIINEND